MPYDGTTKKWKITLPQARGMRILFRVLFALCAFVTPTLIIGFKYNLFTRFEGYKLTMLGIFLLLAVAWRFKSRAVEWVKSWEYSIWKHVFIGFGKIWVYILLIAVLYAAKSGLDKIIYCAEWFAVCQIVAYLIIYPIEQKFDFEVKRLIRKNERKEDLKEALAEMEAENK